MRDYTVKPLYPAMPPPHSCFPTFVNCHLLVCPRLLYTNYIIKL